MSVFKEFKEFVSRGNVVDLAVGVIMGAAFGKIVSSFVADLVMPPIGLALGRVNFTDLKLVMGASPDPTKPPVTLNYGNFLQTTFDFLIIALAVFAMVQAVNRLKRREVASPKPEHIPTPEELLLTEIRDLLKAGAGQPRA